jgi:hypothetical protein
MSASKLVENWVLVAKYILKVVIIYKKLQHLGGVKVKPKKGRWE